MSKAAKKLLSKNIAVAVCMTEIGTDAPAEIQLTPAGQFRARDGRPEGLPGWFIDGALAQRVITWASSQSNDFVIDYEHQTLYAKINGKPAPAAGWWKPDAFEWRDGVGLFATNVEWTDAAKAAIAAKEYRYISPVIAFDRNTGNVIAIVMAALTNYAAVDGMEALAAAAVDLFNFPDEDQPEDQTVDEETLKALGLSKDATPAQIAAAVAALTASHSNVAAVTKALGLNEDASAEDITAAIEALKTTEPDPSKYVGVEVVKELQKEVATLKADHRESEVEKIVTEALTAGKLLPAQETWARDLGKSNIEALKSFVENAPAIEALELDL